MRRGAKRWKAPLLKSCPECDTKTLSHIACPACGYYKDRKVLEVTSL